MYNSNDLSCKNKIQRHVKNLVEHLQWIILGKIVNDLLKVLNYLQKKPILDVQLTFIKYATEVSKKIYRRCSIKADKHFRVSHTPFGT